jgi:hypothetical protein
MTITVAAVAGLIVGLMLGAAIAGLPAAVLALGGLYSIA